MCWLEKRIVYRILEISEVTIMSFLKYPVQGPVWQVDCCNLVNGESSNGVFINFFHVNIYSLKIFVQTFSYKNKFIKLT